MFIFPSGYVLGILMMAIIIVLGVGITLGYFYKRSVSSGSVFVKKCIYFSLLKKHFYTTSHLTV